MPDPVWSTGVLVLYVSSEEHPRADAARSWRLPGDAGWPRPDQRSAYKIVHSQNEGTSGGESRHQSALTLSHPLTLSQTIGNALQPVSPLQPADPPSAFLARRADLLSNETG